MRTFPALVVAAATPLATDLADGRHHARVTAYDTGRRTVTVDDGDVANDHYTRNDNPRLRTLTVADDVRIVVNTPAFERNGSSTEDTGITPAALPATSPTARRRARCSG